MSGIKPLYDGKSDSFRRPKDRCEHIVFTKSTQKWIVDAVGIMENDYERLAQLYNRLHGQARKTQEEYENILQLVRDIADCKMTMDEAVKACQHMINRGNPFSYDSMFLEENS